MPATARNPLVRSTYSRCGSGPQRRQDARQALWQVPRRSVPAPPRPRRVRASTLAAQAALEGGHALGPAGPSTMPARTSPVPAVARLRWRLGIDRQRPSGAATTGIGPPSAARPRRPCRAAGRGRATPCPPRIEQAAETPPHAGSARPERRRAPGKQPVSASAKLVMPSASSTRRPSGSERVERRKPWFASPTPSPGRRAPRCAADQQAGRHSRRPARPEGRADRRRRSGSPVPTPAR